MDGDILQITQEIKYLGVVIRSDLKFINLIYAKISIAKQQLGMVKRALYKASEKAKLLAYIDLCRPHMEYAAAVWDPKLECIPHDIEMVQHKAVRFISRLKSMRKHNISIRKFKSGNSG